MSNVFSRMVCLLSLTSLPLCLSAETFTVVADSWCPYNCEPNSKKEGFGIDLLRAIYEPEGIDVEYKLKSWDEALLAVENGEYNAVIGAYKTNTDSLLFPHSYFSKSVNCFFTSYLSAWQYDGLDSVSDVRLGVISGYSYGLNMDKFLSVPSKNIYQASGDNPLLELIHLMKAGEIDTLIEDKNVFTYAASSLNISDQFNQKHCFLGAAVYMAFSPNNPKSNRYIQIYDKKMKQFLADGTYKKIVSSYQ